MRSNSIKYLLHEGIKNVWVNRVGTVASAIILVVCLLLIGGAGLFSLNMGNIMEDLQKENVVSIYLKQDTTKEGVADVQNKLNEIPNVQNVEFISKEAALKQYNDMLDSVFDDDDNFLPDSYKITLGDLSKYDETIKEIQSLDAIEKVNDKSELASKLSRIDSVVTNVSIGIVVLLLVLSIFIISNTIRVTMHNRRFEISIMKSVGATNGFVRFPFVVEGVTIGLFSAIISTLLLKISYDGVIMAVKQIIPFRHVEFGTVFPIVSLAFLGIGVAFGAISSMISITKYLNKEGGEIFGW